MILRYKRKDGTQMEFELGDRPITIGRSPEADLVILDEKASRLHCGIRAWDGEFFIKDLKSKNGTFVNGERIEMTSLKPGDRIRVGSFLFSFEVNVSKGMQTTLQEVQDEMAQGKGYTTLLREIIEDTESAAAPPPMAETENPTPGARKDPSDTASTKIPRNTACARTPSRKTIKLRVRK